MVYVVNGLITSFTLIRAGLQYYLSMYYIFATLLPNCDYRHNVTVTAICAYDFTNRLIFFTISRFAFTVLLLSYLCVYDCLIFFTPNLFYLLLNCILKTSSNSRSIMFVNRFLRSFVFLCSIALKLIGYKYYSKLFEGSCILYRARQSHVTHLREMWFRPIEYSTSQPACFRPIPIIRDCHDYKALCGWGLLRDGFEYHSSQFWYSCRICHMTVSFLIYDMVAASP